MTAKRPRPSSGTAGMQGMGKSNFSALDAFEDFRKRHSKQNKDVIIDNALRRTTIAKLQEEVGNLHVEVLQLRETNIQLSNQVRRLQAQAGRMTDRSTTAAIDQILKAVPALEHLRKVFNSQSSPTSDNRDFPTVLARQWTMTDTENPTATRPAATGGDILRLMTLEEATEYGSDASTSDIELKVVKIPKNRRMTEIGSVAAPRSPRPAANRPAPSDYFVVSTPPGGSASPGSSSGSRSPSPVKAARSPTKDKKQKRRRESGFLLPQPEQVEERSTTPPSPPSVEALSEIPDWEEGRNIVIPPAPKAVAASNAASATGGKAKDREGTATSGTTKPRARTSTVPASKVKEIAKSINAIASSSRAEVPASVSAPVEGMDGPKDAETGKGKGRATDEALPTLDEDREPASATDAYTANTELTMDSEAAFLAGLADEEGGRVRRARKSVNYKEPNLTKKMRKPDGLSAEEALRPRASVNSLGLAQELATPSSASSATSTISKRTLSHTSGPRRKSVLPKMGAATGRMSDNASDDDDDEHGIGAELAEIDADLGGRRSARGDRRSRETTPDESEWAPSAITSSARSPVSATSLASTTSAASTVSGISVDSATATISSASSDLSVYEPSGPVRSTAASRTSPRKVPAKRPTGLGSGRAPLVGATGRTASGSRLALGERAVENARSVSGGLAATTTTTGTAGVAKAGTAVKRPIGGARRASAIV